MKYLSIGFGNFLSEDRVLGILNPDSSPMKRIREEIKSKGMLIDATHGRKTRSILLMDSGHLVLSGIQSETLVQRSSLKEIEEE
jgi:extracellular matrix regulatory protein A